MGYQMVTARRRPNRARRNSRVLRAVELTQPVLVCNSPYVGRGWELLSPNQVQCFRALNLNNHEGAVYLPYSNESWPTGIGALASGPYSATRFGPTLTPTFYVALVGEEGICASGFRSEGFYDEEVYRGEVVQFVNKLVTSKESPLGTDAKVYLIGGTQPTNGLSDHNKTARLLEESLTYAGYGRALRANIGPAAGDPSDSDSDSEVETESETVEEDHDSEEEDGNHHGEMEDGETMVDCQSTDHGEHVAGENIGRKPYFCFHFGVADKNWILQVNESVLAVGPKL
ncbi:hypothetical protein MMC10_007522 [Thelotrema lepadinum]|nr:hypothetical protein [Thelotrema lepadinum]